MNLLDQDFKIQSTQVEEFHIREREREQWRRRVYQELMRLTVKRIKPEPEPEPNTIKSKSKS